MAGIVLVPRFPHSNLTPSRQLARLLISIHPTLRSMENIGQKRKVLDTQDGEP